MEKKNTKYTVFVHLTIVTLFLMIVLYFKIKRLEGVTYTEVSGTVCCMSNKIYVGLLFPDIPMMYVDLVNGKRVEVPLIDIAYMPGKKIVLRKRSKPDQHGLIYTAAYYQAK